MMGVCTCEPDPECPAHGLDLAVNVRIEPAQKAGGCNFCDRYGLTGEVHVVHGVGGGLTVRFCPSCWKELR